MYSGNSILSGILGGSTGCSLGLIGCSLGLPIGCVGTSGNSGNPPSPGGGGGRRFNPTGVVVHLSGFPSSSK